MKIKFSVLLAALMMIGATAVASQGVKEQIAAAKEQSKSVLLVVHDKDTSPQKLTTVAKSAQSELSDVVVLELNRDDASAQAVVEQYRLSGAPMPIMLVFSDNGLLVGGIAEQYATKQIVVESVPTPKYSDITYALSQAKPVVVLISNSSLKSDKAAREVAKSATNQVQGAEVVVIDPRDAAEARLLEMFNVKPNLKDSYIIAVNSQGAMTGRFSSLPSTEELVKAATEQVQNTQCGSGCGSGCGH